nr:diguanylate cyclase [Vibrio sp. CK2-1]
MLSVIFLFSFLNLGVVYLLEGKNAQASEAVTHTNKVLSTTQDLMISLLDVETGERGFLVTKNKLYLAPYFRAVKQVNEHLTTLEKNVTTGVGVGQVKLLENLRTAINRKLELTKQSVDLAQSDPKQALVLINGNEAKDLMDDIRTYLTRLSTQETLILEQHKADHREANAYINTIMIVEFLVLVFFAIATFSVVNKSLFDPLIKLVNATKKIESGERQVISDFLPKDEIGYLMSSFYEMSEVIIDRHEQLEEKANTDELTKVNNRLGLYKDIELSIAESNVENASLVLCFIDLDEFKQMNDRLGHDCGDEMLKVVANRLKDALRTTDAIYRYGGDEFIVLMKGVTSVATAHQVVARLMETVSQPFLYQGEKLPVNFSLGYALSPEQATDPETLIRYADTAMYHSKRERKQQAKFFDASMLTAEDLKKS